MPAARVASRAAAAALSALCAALLPAAAGAENCGRRLELHPEEFSACRDGSTVCFFFVSEEPYVILPPVEREKLDALETPFDCRQYANMPERSADDKTMRLSGLAFGVLDAVTKSANVSTLCFLAGPDCSFNGLVDYLGNAADPGHPVAGMLLGISGLLIFTPRRVDLGISSAPLLEGKMVIVRRKALASEGFATGIQGAWRAAAQPFATGAWTLCLSALAALLVVICFVSLFRPTPALRGGLLRRNRAAQWISNFIRNTIGGEVDLDARVERGFEPARMALRLSLGCLVALSLVYYEAAIIVGRPDPTLRKSIRGMSDRDLCSTVVLRESALEESFAAIVNSGRKESQKIDFENADEGKRNRTRSWATCANFEECFDMASRGDPVDIESCSRYDATVDYVVVFESVALHQFLKKREYCSSLELVQTRELLFEFDGGWMYSRPANGTVHKSILAIDEGIRKARRDGTTERLVEDAVGSEVECPDVREQVAADLMLFPILIALICPIATAFILMFVFPRVMTEQKRQRVRPRMRPRRRR